MKKNKTNEKLWEKQGGALRDPAELFAGNFETSGIVKESLNYVADKNFTEILQKQKITLFITREYEHLVIALTPTKDRIKQSFFHLAHPSGLVINRKQNTMYVVATRNPNQVWEFKPPKKFLDRIDWEKDNNKLHSKMVPTRSKIFPGAYYLHDLAFINDSLYANSVGQNGIISVDFSNPLNPIPIWWPKCVEKNKKLNNTANFIQLNSIAAGNSLEESFFSASSSQITKQRPGQLTYSVDKKGVIFSGKTRDIFASGLTRPHSARLYNKKIWVDNSGYGEFGFIENGKLSVLQKLPGWTRGLLIKDNIAFVGVSRVLPQFKVYAPGLTKTNYQCGIYAIDIVSGKILGKIIFPNGNQIFSIDYMDSSVTAGFIFDTIAKSNNLTKGFFYKYSI